MSFALFCPFSSNHSLFVQHTEMLRNYKYEQWHVTDLRESRIVSTLWFYM